MSRALNINATQDHIRATCAKNNASISVIETLPGGCTRVVLLNGDAAAIIERAYGKSVIKEAVERTPLSVAAGRETLIQEGRSRGSSRPDQNSSKPSSWRR